MSWREKYAPSPVWPMNAGFSVIGVPQYQKDASIPRLGQARLRLQLDEVRYYSQTTTYSLKGILFVYMSFLHVSQNQLQFLKRDFSCASLTVRHANASVDL